MRSRDPPVCARCRDEIGPAELRFSQDVSPAALRAVYRGDPGWEGRRVTRMFECASCDPGCRLVTDEDEISTPGGCPLPEIPTAPRWRELGAASRIDLAFSGEMVSAVLDGNTCCTTRRTRHGDRGDEFAVAGVVFRLVQVLPATLSDVRDVFHRAEGFATPQAFETAWRALHGGEFEAGRKVRVHVFARLSEGT